MIRPSQRSGFTLIEIALALMVAGLGVMAIFSLFPQGMDSSRKAVDATEVSAFAQFVLDGLQSQLQSPSQSTNNFTTQFSNGGTAAVVSLSHAWLAIASTQKLVSASGTATPKLYVWIPSYYGEFGGGASSPDAVYLTNYAVAAFTYTLDIKNIGGSSARAARLEVWPGDRVGPVSAYSGGSNYPGSTVFYREYIPAF